MIMSLYALVLLVIIEYSLMKINAQIRFCLFCFLLYCLFVCGSFHKGLEHIFQLSQDNCLSVLNFNQSYIIIDGELPGSNDIISNKNKKKSNPKIESTPLGDTCYPILLWGGNATYTNRIILEDGKETYKNIKNHITTGTRANFSCNSGIAIKGPGSAVCKVNGQWSNIPPLCGNYNII